MMHTPHPSRRSVIAEIEERFAEHVDATAGHQFRHPDDISLLSSLQQYYAYLTGRAAPGEIDYSTPTWPTRRRRSSSPSCCGAGNLDAFCLNDTDSDAAVAAEQEALLAEFLPAYLPFASPFELTAPAPGTRPPQAPRRRRWPPDPRQPRRTGASRASAPRPRAATNSPVA